jgi:hypothetical protein
MRNMNIETERRWKGTIMGIESGFRMKDGHFENICPYYIELV